MLRTTSYRLTLIITDNFLLVLHSLFEQSLIVILDINYKNSIFPFIATSTIEIASTFVTKFLLRYKSCKTSNDIHATNCFVMVHVYHIGFITHSTHRENLHTISWENYLHPSYF